jgi:hypothetical protein
MVCKQRKIEITSSWCAKLAYLYMDSTTSGTEAFRLRRPVPSSEMSTRASRPRSARRSEVRLRRPGDREVLIPALPSFHQKKAPASPGLFLLCKREKDCGTRLFGRAGAAGPSLESGLRWGANHCNMQRF